MSKRRGGISLYAKRFHWLLVQLEKEGFSQAEIARRLGTSQSYISKWRNPESGGRQDVGSLTIERVIKGLRISGEYFTGDYDPDEEKSYKLFSLDKARADRQQKELAEGLQRLSKLVEELALRLNHVEDRLPNPSRTGRHS